MKSNKFILDCIKYRDFNNLVSFISKHYNKSFQIFQDKDFYFTICKFNNKNFIHITNNNFDEIFNSVDLTIIKENLSTFYLQNTNYFIINENFNKLFSGISFSSLVSIKLINCYNITNFINHIFNSNNKFFYLHNINLKDTNVSQDDIIFICNHFMTYKGFFRFSIDFEEDSFTINVIVSNKYIDFYYKSKCKFLVLDTFGNFHLQNLIVKTHFEK